MDRIPARGRVQLVDRLIELAPERQRQKARTQYTYEPPTR
jgi:hypothetical protein